MTAAECVDAATGAVAEAVAERIPGAVLGVVTRSGDRAVAVFGLAQREPDSATMRRGTWFDLASLTKVLFTTPAILRLAAAGRIGLDDALTVAIPDLRQYDRTADAARVHSAAGVAEGAAGLLGHQLHAVGHCDRTADRAVVA